MARFADEVLDRVLDFELPLKYLTPNGLDVEFIKSALEKLAGNTKLLVQLIGKIKNNFRAEVQQIPSFEILEQCLLGCVKTATGIKLVSNELELSTSQCKAQAKWIKLEVSCYPY